MATKLDKTLRREVTINGEIHTVTVSPDGVKVTKKGFRKGSELTWAQVLQNGTAGSASDSPPDLSPISDG